MKHILEVGTRTSSFYLWYQVDGKLDENWQKIFEFCLIKKKENDGYSNYST